MSATGHDHADRHSAPREGADFPHPVVAVDLVLTTIRDARLWVLLMERSAPRDREAGLVGRWALPGAFVAIGESLDAAVARVLSERAHLSGAHVEQLYTFGALDRDPRFRVISVAYFALLPPDAFSSLPPGLTLAWLDVPWAGETGGPVTARDAQGGALPLAFDHADILGVAVKRLRGKLDYSDVAFGFLPPLFTLRALQDVHEAILGRPLNKPAFRRRMLDAGKLEATGKRETGSSYRPAELYRRRRQK